MVRSMLHLSRTAMSRLLVPLFLIAATQQATADDGLQPYQMTVVSHAAYGKLIKQGKYDEAITWNLRDKGYEDPFALKNNLCVAFTMVRRFDEAQKACDAAVDINARKGAIRGSVVSGSSIGREQVAMQRAIALSNRGVLRLAIGDTEAALADLELAAAEKSAVGGASSNLARASAQTAVSSNR